MLLSIFDSEGNDVGAAEGGGVTSATLIEQHDAKLLQGALEPAALIGGAGRAKAWAPLQVEQPGQVCIQLVLTTESTGKQSELTAILLLVVEWHCEQAGLTLDAIQHITQGAIHLAYSRNKATGGPTS